MYALRRLYFNYILILRRLSHSLDDGQLSAGLTRPKTAVHLQVARRLWVGPANTLETFGRIVTTTKHSGTNDIVMFPTVTISIKTTTTNQRQCGTELKVFDRSCMQQTTLFDDQPTTGRCIGTFQCRTSSVGTCVDRNTPIYSHIRPGDHVFPCRVRCGSPGVRRSLLRVLQSNAVENYPTPHRPPLVV